MEVPGISEKGKLLTLTTDEALQHGVADARADTLEAALAAVDLRGAEVRRIPQTWAETLVRILTHPANISQARASPASQTLIVVAGSVRGMSLPFLFARAGWDPAAASAPLITSLSDITGVVIYFTTASWYLGRSAAL